MTSKYRPPFTTSSTTMQNPLMNGNLLIPGTVHLNTTSIAPNSLSTTTISQHHLLHIIQAQNLALTTGHTSTNPIYQVINNATSRNFFKNNTHQLYFDGNDDNSGAIGNLILRDGQEYKITLPDGTRIEVKTDGSFEIIDKDAVVKYRACRVREFNSFLNASDKLEAFIRFCGTVGVRQSEVLRLPVELFISWLIIEAARQDNEPEPDIPLIPSLKSRAFPRCTACGRFMSRFKRAKKLEFCAPKCFEVQYAKALA